MAKATHEGTCQICGRLQKLPNGRLSNHGYTVQWGFFSGTCFGAHGKPFEESTDLILHMIKQCKENIIKVKEEIEELKVAKGDKAWKHVYDRRRGVMVWKHVQVIEVEKHSYKHYNNYILDGKTYSGGQMACCFPKSMEEAVLEFNKYYIDGKLVKDIAQLESYIAWQEERIKNWKPGTLIPVKK